MTIDLRGLVPAPVTPFNRDGSVDVDAIHRLGGWLGSVEGVKGLVVLGPDVGHPVRRADDLHPRGQIVGVGLRVEREEDR